MTEIGNYEAHLRHRYATAGIALPADAVDPTSDPYDELAYMAWVLLANVSEGDWTKQTAEWQEAVVRWREAFHASLQEQNA